MTFDKAVKLFLKIKLNERSNYIIRRKSWPLDKGINDINRFISISTTGMYFIGHFGVSTEDALKTDFELIKWRE